MSKIPLEGKDKFPKGERIKKVFYRRAIDKTFLILLNMKVRTQQAELTSIKPYLEHFSSLTLKAYFTNNNKVTPILPMYINRYIITLGDMINEINFPAIAGGFLNN